MSIEKSLELDVINAQIRQYCAFSMGAQLIEATKPSFDPLVIRRDRERLAEALECTIHYGALPLPGIKDIRLTLQNAEKGRTLSGPDLISVLHLMQGIRSVCSYEKSLEIPHESLQDLIGSLVLHPAVEKKLDECLDDYGQVKDNASVQLRQIRRQIREADGQISSAVSRFVAAHSGSIVDSIVTYRSGRAVVLVKATEKNTFGGLVYGDSASGQASYVEPASLVGPNNLKQELLAKQTEEINRILRECSSEVGQIAAEELANLETCALLDAIFAKASWGKDHNAIAAQLTQKKEIRLEKARHPLIDPKKVVANNYHLAQPEKMLLITGPNTGGKTVSLKVIGLFVLMTYCGMPVTAEEAEIPYFDHVYADIGDDQSVVSSLSSFSAHIAKLAEVTNHATADSLALLDEIGSGTDPREGESLAIAILNHLREVGCMTVATTHYNRLKMYGKRHDDILLASVQFDMEKLAPTFHYVEGLTGQSNAFEVAERYGLDRSIIRYAKFLKEQAKSQEDELAEKLEQQLQQTESDREKLAAEIAANAEARRQLEHEKAQLERERDAWQQKADAEADKIRDQARLQADQILEEMRQKQATAKYHEVLSLRQQLKPKEENPAPLPELHDEHRSFQVGDTVELRSSQQTARIARIGRKDMTILLNGREMRVRPEQIRFSDKIIPVHHDKPVITFSSADLFAGISSECNLIGMHVDEAMEELSGYVDQARLHHLKSFRIIHGDGSGALRKAVHAWLDQQKDIDSYRLGMPQEGGTGATVVTMKETL